jgi:hypothetical protein
MNSQIEQALYHFSNRTVHGINDTTVITTAITTWHLPARNFENTFGLALSRIRAQPLPAVCDAVADKLKVEGL